MKTDAVFKAFNVKIERNHETGRGFHKEKKNTIRMDLNVRYSKCNNNEIIFSY